MGGEEVRALDGVDLSINNNEYLSIMGPSGSGKSTMMNMIGCLDSPSSGLYEFEGEKVHICLLYTSPSPRDMRRSRMPSSA